MINGDYSTILQNFQNKSKVESSTLRPFYKPSKFHFDVCRINQLEAKFLAMIKFNVCVTGEDYAMIYFRITVLYCFVMSFSHAL